MRIHQVNEVDHATSSRFSRGPETFVVVKVEDTIKARTKATRNDKWLDESFSIDIDKANEIELTVYDKSGDRPTPIGMLWVRISDIAEEMRRKKIETELNASGWVSADKMGDSGTPRSDHMGSPMGSSHSGNFGSMAPHPGPQGQQDSSNAPPTVMIDSWFALEPFGRIQLSMSFGRVQIPLTRPQGCANTVFSQTTQGPPPLRYWSEPSRCCASEEGRYSRKAGPQICYPTILQHHALRTLWGIPQIRRRHAVRRLQIHLSQEMLSKGCHQVYQQGQLRDRSR